MAAPDHRTPKRSAAMPARDTAETLEPTIWQMNPIPQEQHDPARCTETLDAPIATPVNPNTPQPPATTEPAQFTPKTRKNQIRIGQRPSEEDPLGITNLSLENLASLIFSTVRNLNKPEGGEGSTHHQTLLISPHLLATTTTTNKNKKLRTKCSKDARGTTRSSSY
eukprot:3259731-Pleurochrysis_carterae.AAC.1